MDFASHRLRSAFQALVCGRRARTGWGVAFAILLAVVAWLAVTPNPPPSMDLGWDKLNHLAAFGALGFCGSLTWRARLRSRWMLALALLAFGGGIELVQSLVPGRDAEWADLGADAAGIVAGLVLASLAIGIATASLIERLHRVD